MRPFDFFCLDVGFFSARKFDFISLLDSKVKSCVSFGIAESGVEFFWGGAKFLGDFRKVIVFLHFGQVIEGESFIDSKRISCLHNGLGQEKSVAIRLISKTLLRKSFPQFKDTIINFQSS